MQYNRPQTERMPGIALIAILGLSLLLPIRTALAQDLVDVIHLRNGELYRGHLCPARDSATLCLETLCLNRRIFPLADVLEITQEKVSLQEMPLAGTLPANGYFNRTDLGPLIGTGNNQQNYIMSIQMVNGYRFSHRFYAGIGTGMEFFEYAMAPLYADFSYLIPRGRLGIFCRGSIGHAFPLEQPGSEWGLERRNSGGLLYVAGLGTKFNFRSGNALVISVLYRFQSLKSSLKETWTDEVRNLEVQYNRLSLRVGLMFE